VSRFSRAVVVTFSMNAAACASSRVSSEGLGERYPRSMNPEDAQGRTVLLAEDGSCYVELPTPEAPRSGGADRPSQSVACPETLRDPAFRACTGHEIRATSRGDDCVCDTTGNPPPPTVPRVDCPR